MIRANELRIGNYVLVSVKTDNDEKLEIRIDINDLRRIYEGSELYNFEPILLTEEWLLKFGFEDIRELDNIDFKEYRMINQYSFCVQFPCGVEAHCYAGNYPIAIKYLHQLQNLYFALTNKELTIQL